MARSDLSRKIAVQAAAKVLRYQEKYEKATTEYLRHAAIEYAARFPRRKVQVRCGMGTISVWVQKGGYWHKDDKPFDYYDNFDLERSPYKRCAPAFLKTIEELDAQFGKTYNFFPSCHDVFMEFEGGKLVRERTQW